MDRIQLIDDGRVVLGENTIGEWYSDYGVYEGVAFIGSGQEVSPLLTSSEKLVRWFEENIRPKGL